MSVKAEDKTIDVCVSGYVTNPNFSLKKFQCLLFINSEFLWLIVVTK